MGAKAALDPALIGPPRGPDLRHHPPVGATSWARQTARRGLRTPHAAPFRPRGRRDSANRGPGTPKLVARPFGLAGLGALRGAHGLRFVIIDDALEADGELVDLGQRAAYGPHQGVGSHTKPAIQA